MYIRTETTHFVDACDLGDLIAQEYGVDEDSCNIPYFIMEDARKIEMDASGLSGDEAQDAECQKDYDEAVAEFKGGKQLDRELLELLMCDLCCKGKIPAGNYILSFDD